MKLKYYLRGAGVGVLVTTIIFAIAIAVESPKMSRSDIEKEARKLGMEYTEDTTSKLDDTKNDDANDSKTDGDDTKDDGVKSDDTKSEGNDDAKSGDKDDASKIDKSDSQDKSKKVVKFTINRGDSSVAVAKRLKDASLVSDADAFDKYLCDKDYDNNLVVGEFEIPEGSSYEEIAKILTTKKK